MQRNGPAEAVTALRARGYALLPAPREVDLGEGTVAVDASWKVALSKTERDDIAVRTLLERLAEEHALHLETGAPGERTILLGIEEGAVRADAEEECLRQASLIEVRRDGVKVIGNAPAGLFYGVQTLLQLLAGDGREPLRLPLLTIRDWPRYGLRVTHFDTKHHQDRPETLRRFIDWLARFKVNAVAFELEDKFEYPSHPVIGAPGAFTTAELQDLTRYALERHVQLIPDVQAPAHMCYVLKHPEFAHLRCDGSNYQICMDDPEALRLVFDMYDDACAATPGVGYFLVSTDEVYYAGICERYRKPYNPVNRSLTWVDFVRKAHEHLGAKGRRVIIWAEFPLLKEHIELLPPDIINGVLGSDEEFIREQDRRGIRQLVYVPIQGAEHYFPHYFPYRDARGFHPGRLRDAFRTTLRRGADCGRPMGTFAAAWDDCGLHNETFWLGWAVMAQGGWSPGAAPLEQTVADFIDIYYGRDTHGLAGAYRDLQEQAEFWGGAWERLPSKVRGPGYGYSEAKTPVVRRDRTLLAPALPDPRDLAVEPLFARRYARLIEEAGRHLRQNDRLLARLHENLPRASRNRYNLEVFLSIARYFRHFIELVIGLGEAEETILRARKAHEKKRYPTAAGLIEEARARVARLLEDLYHAFGLLKAVWEKSRFEKGRTVAGRRFLHVMDDVKDHPADRRPDLSYLIEPEENIGLADWLGRLDEIIASYARTYGVDRAPGGQPAE